MWATLLSIYCFKTVSVEANQLHNIHTMETSVLKYVHIHQKTQEYKRSSLHPFPWFFSSLLSIYISPNNIQNYLVNTWTGHHFCHISVGASEQFECWSWEKSPGVRVGGFAKCPTQRAPPLHDLFVDPSLGTAVFRSVGRITGSGQCRPDRKSRGALPACGD